MQPPKKSGPPRRGGPGGPKRPTGPGRGGAGQGGSGRRFGASPDRGAGRDAERGDVKPRFYKGDDSRSERPRGERPDRSRTDTSAGPTRGPGPRDAAARPRGPRAEGAPSERPRSDRPRAERTGTDGFRPNGVRQERARSAGPDGPRQERVRTDRPDGPRQDRGRPDRPRNDVVKSYPPRRPRGKGPTPTTNPHPAHAAASEGKGEPQRIAKLLARAGVASRREIERMIEEGRIAKDGVVIDTPATLLTSLHGVTVDEVAIAAPEPTRLFLFHKPTGYLTTERDPAGRPTIYDRLPADLPRVMPIGRLDMNTEGLLLLTTDGGFKREMELPATGVPRTYRARAFGEVSQQQLEDLFDGLEIDGIRYGAIEANLERRTGRNQWIEMTLTEGKNREVRRVLEHMDLKVNRLIRTSYGPFHLGELPVGAVEEVREHELAHFRKSLRDAGKNAEKAEKNADRNGADGDGEA
nr:pseudouridine synthase [Sphingobium sp. Leaf26]